MEDKKETMIQLTSELSRSRQLLSTNVLVVSLQLLRINLMHRTTLEASETPLPTFFFPHVNHSTRAHIHTWEHRSFFFSLSLAISLYVELTMGGDTGGGAI
jgi:hypothetical protein